jgi:hypothetical protein
MIERTQEQRQAVKSNEPPRLVDPDTNETYVLVRAAVYERLRALLAEDTVSTTAEMLDRIMAEDDARDPYLAKLQKQYGDKV